MTHETRIALVVGLLFIIGFGLALSELSGTGTPEPAGEGEDVVHVPYWRPTPEVRKVVPLRHARAAAVRRRARPEPADHLAQRPRQVRTPVVRVRLIQPAPDPVSDQVAVAPPPKGPAPGRPPGPADGPAQPSSPGPPTRAPVAPKPALAGKYTVQPNDNLSTIAKRVYGRGSERFYRAIFQANRSVLPDENTPQVGQVLPIPPLPQAKRQPRAGHAPPGRADVPRPSSPEAPVPDGRPQFGPGEPKKLPPSPPKRRYAELDFAQLRRYLSDRSGARAPARRGYVVRGGDSLTSIAREVLNDESPAAVRRLYDANKDKLDSPDVLPVGLELLIPRQP